jgi:RND family efflux transporter MFP subunit
VRTTFTVQRGDIVSEAKLSGRASPFASETVKFQMPGHVSDVFVQVNDLVQEGQLLAELVEYSEMEAKVDSTRRVIRRAEIALEIARLELEKMNSEGRPAYERKIQELKVELAQMAYEDVITQMGLDASAEVDAEMDAELSKAQVFAPEAGQVIFAVTPGRAVTPATVVFILGESGTLEIVADLDAGQGDEQLRSMFEGMPVQVTLSKAPEIHLNGKIRQLPSPFGTGPSDDKSVHIALDEPYPADMLSGDKVNILITLASKNGILWLPPEAIRHAGGRTFVIMDSGSGPKRIEVELGIQTRDKTEILSGLEEGQVVFGQ